MPKTMTNRQFFEAKCREHKPERLGDWHCLGALAEAAVKIAEAGAGEDGWRFLDGYVKYICEAHPAEYDAPALAKANIGYLIGYYGAERRAMATRFWNRVGGVEHPVFGTSLANDA